jgi:hypothetical protein
MGGAYMDDNTLCSKIKEQLGITTEDVVVSNNIKLKAVAVKKYLIKGGAVHLNSEINETDLSCIAIGVNDLLNNKAGDTKFSPAFDFFAQQICRG